MSTVTFDDLLNNLQMDRQTKKSDSITKPHFQFKDFEKKKRLYKSSFDKNEIVKKPLQTLRHSRQIKKLNYLDDVWSPLGTDRKFRLVHQLELEKQNLIRSLEILKKSAVSAIEAKDVQIEKLREWNFSEQYQKIEFFQNELQRSKRIRRELEQQREDLNRQMHLQREKYIDELERKERIIEELVEEMQKLQQELYRLEQLNTTKDAKIILLQQQVYMLSQQSKNSKIHSTNMDLDQTLKYHPFHIDTARQNNSDISCIINSEDEPSQNRQALAQTIKQLQKTHTQQYTQLALSYDKKIEKLHEKIQVQTKDYKQQQQVQYRTLTNNSRRNYTKDVELSEKSQGVFNSVLLNKFHSNKQSELQTSRSKAIMRNLKEQIPLLEFNDYACSQHRLPTFQDIEDYKQSQYEQEPHHSFKRYNTYETFAMSQCSILRQSQKQPSQCAQKQNKGVFWQRTYIFAAGLLSGVTLTSLIKFSIKSQ